jgi:hypothetical protein
MIVGCGMLLFFFDMWSVWLECRLHSLNKAVEPVQTRCCDTTFCREHITKVGLLKL